MREYFDHAFEGFCNSMQPFIDLGERMVETAKIIFVYATLPLWIVPYMFYRKNEERKEDHA